MNKIACIIPARSGSNRLKKKNFKKFGNKMLIEETIIAAKKAKIFDKIVLSSDINLTNLCKKYKIDFFQRDKFKDKYSTVSKATIYTIKELNMQTNFNTVVQLMPTCPLRDSADIKNSLINFFKKKNKFQISCFKISWLHFFWAIIEKKKYKKFLFKGKNFNRSDKIFFPSGAIWIANIKNLIKKKSFYCHSTKFFELNWINSIDIDIQEDFDNAKILSKLRKYNFKNEKK